MTETTQRAKTMKRTKEMKIKSAARKVVKGYIQTLAEGGEPPFLRAQIEMSKYDILSDINDNRINYADSLEAVFRHAKWMIKDALNQNQHLAERLIAFRKAREEQEDRERMAEQRSWAPFPFPKKSSAK